MNYIMVIGGNFMSYNKTMRLSELKKGITVVLKKINTEENIERHLKT